MKKLIVLVLFSLNFTCIYSQNISDEFKYDTARVEQNFLLHKRYHIPLNLSGKSSIFAKRIIKQHINIK